MSQILEVDDEWNILKSTLHWRGVQNFSITLANLLGFLVNSIFHKTKIPTVDMKVHVCSKFRIFFLEKIKYPLTMNFRKNSPSKYRGKLQKMGVLYTHSPKSHGPFPQLPKILFFLNKKFPKKWIQLNRLRRRPVASGRLRVGGPEPADNQ